MLGIIISDGLKALPHPLDVISLQLILKFSFEGSLGFFSSLLKLIFQYFVLLHITTLKGMLFLSTKQSVFIIEPGRVVTENSYSYGRDAFALTVVNIGCNTISVGVNIILPLSPKKTSSLWCQNSTSVRQ